MLAACRRGSGSSRDIVSDPTVTVSFFNIIHFKGHVHPISYGSVLTSGGISPSAPYSFHVALGVYSNKYVTMGKYFVVGAHVQQGEEGAEIEGWKVKYCCFPVGSEVAVAPTGLVAAEALLVKLASNCEIAAQYELIVTRHISEIQTFINNSTVPAASSASTETKKSERVRKSVQSQQSEERTKGQKQAKTSGKAPKALSPHERFIYELRAARDDTDKMYEQLQRGGSMVDANNLIRKMSATFGDALGYIAREKERLEAATKEARSGYFSQGEVNKMLDRERERAKSSFAGDVSSLPTLKDVSAVGEKVLELSRSTGTQLDKLERQINASSKSAGEALNPATITTIVQSVISKSNTTATAPVVSEEFAEKVYTQVHNTAMGVLERVCHSQVSSPAPPAMHAFSSYPLSAQPGGSHNFFHQPYYGPQYPAHPYSFMPVGATPPPVPQYGYANAGPAPTPSFPQYQPLPHAHSGPPYAHQAFYGPTSAHPSNGSQPIFSAPATQTTHAPQHQVCL